MSYSFSANGDAAPGPYGCVTTERFTADTGLPELGKLMKLRDALLVLKGPLANSPAWRSLVEGRLLGNEVCERVLGKLASDTAN